MVTYRPSQVAPILLEILDHWLLTRLSPAEEIATVRYRAHYRLIRCAIICSVVILSAIRDVLRDNELARRLNRLAHRNLPDMELRQALAAVVGDRYYELDSLV